VAQELIKHRAEMASRPPNRNRHHIVGPLSRRLEGPAAYALLLDPAQAISCVAKGTTVRLCKL